MRSNPFIRRGMSNVATYDGPAMTLSGAKNKTFILLGITALGFAASWLAVLMSGSLLTATTLIGVSSIVAIVLAMITCFNPARAKTFGMLYAVCEGLLIGSFSLVFELTVFPGIVVRTMILTFLAVLFTLVLYNYAPDLAGKIRRGVLIATLSIAAISILGLVFSLFGIPFIFWNATPLGIGFSAVVVLIAIANLMIDYDNMEIGRAHV